MATTAERYFSTLTPQKMEAIRVVVAALNKRGLTNRKLQAGILAVISKESNFVPVREVSYATTPNERIRRIFGKHVADLSESELTRTKQDAREFFDHVYGSRGDNRGKGYFFRGGGLNQLTFRSGYKKYGEMIGKDLVGNPDLITRLDVAADVAAAYFYNSLVNAPSLQRTAYKFQKPNDFQTVTDGALAAYNANAGWGKSPEKIKQDQTGGYALTMKRAKGFYMLLSTGAATGKGNSDNAPEAGGGSSWLPIAAVAVAVVALAR